MTGAGRTTQVAQSRQRKAAVARHALAAVAFVGGLVFLIVLAGVGLSRVVDRIENDDTPERLEMARWDCVESFVRSSAARGESLQLAIEPPDDLYIRQRVIETVYPAVGLTTSGSARVLRVIVRPGDETGTTCRGLDLSIDRS